MTAPEVLPRVFAAVPPVLALGAVISLFFSGSDFVSF